MPYPSQPIVIAGGILSFPTVYARMRNALEELTGLPVWIIDIHSYDWARSAVPSGWAPLLQKLDDAVCEAAERSRTGQVTVVGHSAGGLVGRLYVSPEPFLGQAYRGSSLVDHLVTLSSPHYYQRTSIHGGWLPGWLQERYPDAYYAPRVHYTSVAGKLIRGDSGGTARERLAHGFYKELGGDGEAWGDGLVPVRCALLDGSEQLVLEGVSHYAGFGGPWFGEPQVIARWWG